MRPDVYDTDQPHHIVSRDNEYGDTIYWCKCGKFPPTKSLTTYLGGGIGRPLHEHIRASFDGRCHFTRYKMECGRHYGHRGVHQQMMAPLSSGLRALLRERASAR